MPVLVPSNEEANTAGGKGVLAIVLTFVHSQYSNCTVSAKRLGGGLGVNTRRIKPDGGRAGSSVMCR